MKDCKTFLKLQEAAVNKQAEAKKQGYKGNTSNAPSTTQQANNGASQGQNQPTQGHDNDGGYILSKGHITAMIQPVPKSNKEEKSITRQVNLAVTSPPETTGFIFIRTYLICTRFLPLDNSGLNSSYSLHFSLLVQHVYLGSQFGLYNINFRIVKLYH
jgi:hypothetical protein